MKTMLLPTTIPLAILILHALAPSARAASPESEKIPSALHEYIARPDASFAWKILQKSERSSGRVYEMELVSQTWQGIVWKHALNLYEPKSLHLPGHVLLFITGGSIGKRPGEDSVQMGLKLAQLTGARVAILHQVPNQPLLGGRKEDDLISETWLRYLASGDATWPLLFPMAKSAVRAMDAIEAVAKSEWNGTVSGFVVTGASKRGWTTWLAGAADKRVVGIAPMVIDTLNFQKQMQYQIETWGKYSEQIDDYSRKGLAKFSDGSPRETELRRMVDPYSYLSALAIPKLLIHGTNDRYWTVDATKFYWDDLVGPKYMLKLPNAGHGLDGGVPLALGTLAAFFRHTVAGTPLPQLQWRHEEKDGKLILSVQSSVKPKSVRLWTASSESKDFRDSKWRSQPLEEKGGEFSAALPKPVQGHVALFGETQFEENGVPYSLTTVVWRY